MNEAGYRRDGFCVIPGFKSPDEIRSLRERAAHIVDAFDPADNAHIFTTGDQAAHSDKYFLESGDKVRCFFEEDAFDATGALRRPKSLSINKIGHGMHDADPVFAAFSHDTRLAAIATAAGLQEPLIYQSMYIFKQPHIGGEVKWHQDAAFFATDPISVTTFWFALEDADRTNGCLWVEPGGHRSALRERFVVRDGIAKLETIDTTPWPSGESVIPLEVQSGTLVVFHGLLPHYSAPNRSTQSRHAFTLHVIDGRAIYSPLNWLQRTDARGF